ncbi:MAG: hypothetical protein WAN05_20975, partial [Roseiarcus sp.]
EFVALSICELRKSAFAGLAGSSPAMTRPWSGFPNQLNSTAIIRYCYESPFFMISHAALSRKQPGRRRPPPSTAIIL